MHIVSEFVQDLEDEALRLHDEPQFATEGVDDAEDNVHYGQPRDELSLFDHLINLN